MAEHSGNTAAGSILWLSNAWETIVDAEPVAAIPMFLMATISITSVSIARIAGASSDGRNVSSFAVFRRIASAIAA
jgi:hypothetical protein